MGARLRFKVLSVLGLLAAGATCLAVACGGDDGGGPAACEGPACDGGALSETSTVDSSKPGTDGNTPTDAGRDADADSSVLSNCGDGGLPGTLDPSFGNGGIVVLPLNGAGLTAVVVQPDGKIVAVGSSQNDAGLAAFTVVRLMPDGSLDAAFGGGGVVQHNVAGNQPHVLNAVALQPDGKVVAAGTTRPGVSADFAVVRYLPNGSLDTSFGNGGVTTTDFTSVESANEVLLLPDGRIVVAGTTSAGNDDIALSRYTASGSLDTTFGGTGMVTIDIRGTSDAARAAVLLPSGKLVVTGTSQDPNGGRLDTVALRINGDGSLDTTYGTLGFYLSGFGPTGSQTANAVALDATGRALLVGKYGSAQPDDFGFVRLTTLGAQDVTFGSGGLATIDFEGRSDDAYAVLIQEDGKAVVVGSSLSATATDSRVGLSRHLPSGDLDPGFGVAGKVLTPLPPGFSGSSTARGATLTACGVLTVGGWTDTGPANRMGLVRYRR